MRCLKLSFLLLSLSIVGACDNKTAATGEPPKTEPGKTAPAPIDPNQKTNPAPVQAPVMAKPTPGTGKSYLLRIKESQGNKWSYVYNVKTFADPKGLAPDDPMRKSLAEYSEAVIAGTMTMEVISAKDGRTTYRKSATVEKSIGKGVWKKQADDLAKEKPKDVIYTWDEKMANVDIGKNEDVDPMTNSLHTLFPTDPVQVGSTWEYRPFPEATVNSKAKLEAVETVDGVSTLRIAVTFPPSQEGEVNTMKVWIDPTNGRFIKIQTDSTSTAKGLRAENHLVQELKR
jgi:hypothetical protein